MIKLYNNLTNALLGQITEQQLQFLEDQMEEDNETDQDYYINDVELEALQEAGADSGLIALLQGALDENGEGEVRWERV